MRSNRLAAAMLVAALLATGCQQTSEGTHVRGAIEQQKGMEASRPAWPTVVAVGDISPPRLGSQQATSDLALRLDPTRVLALGDEQYDDGELAEFRAYYDPTWGRLKERTYPSPGNHEYNTAGAAGYFSYFGPRARPSGRSYYSFNLGAWHLVSLDSNIDRAAGSEQVAWLRRDLRRSQQPCVLAYWHHPRFSSGSGHGSDSSVAAFWEVLHRARADVVLGGHEHNYERFALQGPSGFRTPDGIRQFVVGTGGASHYGFGAPLRTSQRRISNTYGVLRLVLRPRSYGWRFISQHGEVLDRGASTRCH